MEKPVTFKSRGKQVVGMLHVPDKAAGPVPAVVFFHGFTGNKVETHRLFVKAARKLAARGIASLRFDFRGSGDSEGDFSEMTIESLVDDGWSAIRFIRRLKMIDPECVGVVGFSMGGMIAAQLLGEDRRLKAGVLWAPVANPGELVGEMREAANGEGRMPNGNVDLGGWIVASKFIEEYASEQPLAHISRAYAPILLLHGTEDDSVPGHQSQAYLSAFREKGTKVKLRFIEGAGHAFESAEFEQIVIDHTSKWLVRYLL